jgi:hypothetical protein
MPTPDYSPALRLRYTSKDDLCYVLLEVGPAVSRQQLEQLQPDVAAMHAAASSQQVHGLIVCLVVPGAAEAAAGGSSAGQCAHLLRCICGQPAGPECAVGACAVSCC